MNSSETLATSTARERRSQPASRADWPSLRVAEWTDTRDTLHMWSQIVGKVRLAKAPMVNHWWQVPLYVLSSRADDDRGPIRPWLLRVPTRLPLSRAPARNRLRLSPLGRA